MANQYLWIGIAAGLFFVGLAVGYGVFSSTVSPNMMFQNPQTIGNMMQNPQMMNQWNQQMMNTQTGRQQMMTSIMQNPQFMNEMMNDPEFNRQMMENMRQDKQFAQSTMTGMMNDPELRKQMMQNMASNQQFMQEMMGQGMMMNNMMNGGMMGGSMMGSGMQGFGMGSMMMSNTIQVQEPLNIDNVEKAAQEFLTLDNQNLAIKDLMEFENNFYFIMYEKDTGIGALEMLVWKDSKTMMPAGVVMPEPGANMMWNTKYGMMQTNGTTEMTITSDEAQSLAQTYLDKNFAGAVAEDVDQFYGYYTIHVETDGKISGMLSVNGYTGQIIYHWWHGQFMQEK
ncbi:MAG: hypothetical protein DA330_01170 [Nitrososphaera sp.]|nr:hypothetical protein [Nitrososphaera sp.]